MCNNDTAVDTVHNILDCKLLIFTEGSSSLSLCLHDLLGVGAQLAFQLLCSCLDDLLVSEGNWLEARPRKNAFFIPGPRPLHHNWALVESIVGDCMNIPAPGAYLLDIYVFCLITTLIII